MNTEKQDPDIDIHITKNFKDITIDQSRIKKLIKNICDNFKLKKVTISIVIVGNDEITKLNKKFLNRNSTTDCLSFDLSDKNSGYQKTFEIIVNAQKAIKETEKRPHFPQDELALYITHGILHNLGFNDDNPENAKKMHDTEDQILQQQGFGFVYNSRSAAEN